MKLRKFENCDNLNPNQKCDECGQKQPFVCIQFGRDEHPTVLCLCKVCAPLLMMDLDIFRNMYGNKEVI